MKPNQQKTIKILRAMFGRKPTKQEIAFFEKQKANAKHESREHIIYNHSLPSPPLHLPIQ